jgi:hypothetical protein
MTITEGDLLYEGDRNPEVRPAPRSPNSPSEAAFYLEVLRDLHIQTMREGANPGIQPKLGERTDDVLSYFGVDQSIPFELPDPSTQNTPPPSDLFADYEPNGARKFNLQADLLLAPMGLTYDGLIDLLTNEFGLTGVEMNYAWDLPALKTQTAEVDAPPQHYTGNPLVLPPPPPAPHVPPSNQTTYIPNMGQWPLTGRGDVTWGEDTNNPIYFLGGTIAGVAANMLANSQNEYMLEAVGGLGIKWLGQGSKALARRMGINFNGLPQPKMPKPKAATPQPRRQYTPEEWAEAWRSGDLAGGRDNIVIGPWQEKVPDQGFDELHDLPPIDFGDDIESVRGLPGPVEPSGRKPFDWDTDAADDFPPTGRVGASGFAIDELPEGTAASLGKQKWTLDAHNSLSGSPEAVVFDEDTFEIVGYGPLGESFKGPAHIQSRLTDPDYMPDPIRVVMLRAKRSGPGWQEGDYISVQVGYLRETGAPKLGLSDEFGIGGADIPDDIAKEVWDQTWEGFDIGSAERIGGGVGLDPQRGTQPWGNIWTREQDPLSSPSWPQYRNMGVTEAHWIEDQAAQHWTFTQEFIDREYPIVQRYRELQGIDDALEGPPGGVPELFTTKESVEGVVGDFREFLKTPFEDLPPHIQAYRIKQNTIEGIIEQIDDKLERLIRKTDDMGVRLPPSNRDIQEIVDLKQQLIDEGGKFPPRWRGEVWDSIGGPSGEYMTVSLGPAKGPPGTLAGYEEFADDPLFREFVELSDKTQLAEKDSILEPFTTEQEALMHATPYDWEAFSRSRGYSEEEITDFRRWLEVERELSAKYPDDPDFTFGIVYQVSHDSPSYNQRMQMRREESLRRLEEFRAQFTNDAYPLTPYSHKDLNELKHGDLNVIPESMLPDNVGLNPNGQIGYFGIDDSGRTTWDEGGPWWPDGDDEEILDFLGITHIDGVPRATPPDLLDNLRARFEGPDKTGLGSFEDWPDWRTNTRDSPGGHWPWRQPPDEWRFPPGPLGLAVVLSPEVINWANRTNSSEHIDFMERNIALTAQGITRANRSTGSEPIDGLDGGFRGQAHGLATEVGAGVVPIIGREDPDLLKGVSRDLRAQGINPSAVFANEIRREMESGNAMIVGYKSQEDYELAMNRASRYGVIVDGPYWRRPTRKSVRPGKGTEWTRDHLKQLATAEHFYPDAGLRQGPR